MNVNRSKRCCNCAFFMWDKRYAFNKDSVILFFGDCFVSGEPLADPTAAVHCTGYTENKTNPCGYQSSELIGDLACSGSCGDCLDRVI